MSEYLNNNMFVTKIKTNLDGVLETTSMFEGIMVSGDDCANQIIVELYRGRVPFMIPDPITEGTKIVAYFIRGDGYTLETEGTVQEGKAVVVIPALAYAVAGNLSIAIRMFLGPYTEQQRGYHDIETHEFVIVTDMSITVGPHGEEIQTRTANLWRNKITIASASCYIQMSETTSIIDPGHYIPDVNDIISKMEDLDDLELNLNNAEEFRTSAETSRVAAESARVIAEEARVAAETTRQQNDVARQNAIQNMTVGATALAPDATPTATISNVSGHKHIQFGLVPGKPFVIKRAFASIAQMNAYTGTDVALYDFVIIDSSIDDPDNAKLYMKSANDWSYVTDLSGATGIQGPAGPTGNGISNIVLNQDYTLTVNFTNGTSYTSGSIRGPKGDKGDKGDPGQGGNSVSFDQTTQTLTLAFG